MNPENTVFAGKLRTGDPVVFISGNVDTHDCDWAIKMLDELIEAGYESITFDFAGVMNVSHQWFEAAIHRRRSQYSRVHIKVQDTVRAATGMKAANSLCDRLASAFVDFKARLLASQA